MQHTDVAAAEAFIAKWKAVDASELATSQPFLIGLCDLLGVDQPHHAQDYMFERPLTFQHADGSTSAGRVDLYKRGSFVLESKKLRAGAHTRGFDEAMLRAHSQAQAYARALPASEGRPPFLVVVDVGHRIELYSEFSRTGGSYVPFPDPRSHRIALEDLRDPDIRERLRKVWPGGSGARSLPINMTKPNDTQGDHMSSNTNESPLKTDRVLGMEEVPTALHKPMRWWERNRNKFWFVILAVVAVFLANSIGGDLYDRWKPWKESDDEFVQKIAEAQRKEFDNLRASLGDIRSSLPAEGRDAFRTMERALANVERDSAGLVQQLDLAKSEIEALRAVAVNRGGVGAGYDFTLSENSSMDLAPGALVGLQSVGSSGAYINLTSGGTTTFEREFVRAGESLKFAGSGGREE